MALSKIISGGQVGADRVALEVAREAGVRTGGWAPAGFRTKRGPTPELATFELRETEGDDYPTRTARNVRDADGTLLFMPAWPERGMRLTRRLATENPLKRHLLVDLDGLVDSRDALAQELVGQGVAQWIVHWDIETLNVAGPATEDYDPLVERVLREALRVLRECEQLELLPVPETAGRLVQTYSVALRVRRPLDLRDETAEEVPGVMEGDLRTWIPWEIEDICIHHLGDAWRSDDPEMIASERAEEEERARIMEEEGAYWDAQAESEGELRLEEGE